MKKRCFKCERYKPKNMFYKHPEMDDGRLGKCKACAKADVRANREKRRAQYAAYERERFKRPHRKAQVLIYARRRAAAHPGKERARRRISNMLRYGKLKRQACGACGSVVRVQAHHLDYRRPLLVEWLCFAHHRARHGQVVLA